MQRPEEVRRVCERLELVHCVDLLRRDPALIGELEYFRLHGLGLREFNYSYRFSDLDLLKLAKRVEALFGMGVGCAYVMFNNITMVQDGRRFLLVSGVLSK